MDRQLRLLWMLFRMKLTRAMVFRFNFFGAFFVDGSMFLLQLITFSAIYGQTDAIGGWNRGAMQVFIGTFSMINALNMVVFFFGVNAIPRKVLSGELDLYLCKPMNPLLRLSLESIDAGSLPLVFLSVLIILSGVRQLPVMPGPGQTAVYLLLIPVMTLLWYDVMLLVRTVPFFFPSARRFERVEELLTLCFKVPGTLFKGVFKLLFYLVIPYGVMATFPVQALTGALNPAGFLYALLLAGFFTFIALFVWKKALQNYQSASS